MIVTAGGGFPLVGVTAVPRGEMAGGGCRRVTPINIPKTQKGCMQPAVAVVAVVRL